MLTNLEIYRAANQLVKRYGEGQPDDALFRLGLQKFVFTQPGSEAVHGLGQIGNGHRRLALTVKLQQARP